MNRAPDQPDPDIQKRIERLRRKSYALLVPECTLALVLTLLQVSFGIFCTWAAWEALRHIPSAPWGIFQQGFLFIIGYVCSSNAFFALLSYFVPPPPPQMPGIWLQPAEHPEVYAFVREICDGLKIRPPRAIYLYTSEFAFVLTRNAPITMVAPQRYDLCVGASLFSAHTRSELGAFLARVLRGNVQSHSQPLKLLQRLKAGAFLALQGNESEAGGLMTRIVKLDSASKYLLVLLSFPAWPQQIIRWIVALFVTGALPSWAVRWQLSELLTGLEFGGNVLASAFRKTERARLAYEEMSGLTAVAAAQRVHSPDFYTLLEEDLELKRRLLPDHPLPALDSYWTRPDWLMRLFTYKDPPDREDVLAGLNPQTPPEAPPLWELFFDRLRVRQELTLCIHQSLQMLRRSESLTDPEDAYFFLMNEREDDAFAVSFKSYFDPQLLEVRGWAFAPAYPVFPPRTEIDSIDSLRDELKTWSDEAMVRARARADLKRPRKSARLRAFLNPSEMKQADYEAARDHETIEALDARLAQALRQRGGEDALQPLLLLAATAWLTPKLEPISEKLTALENEASSFISDDDSLETFHHKLYAERKELETVLQAVHGFGIYGLTNQPAGTPASAYLLREPLIQAEHPWQGPGLTEWCRELAFQARTACVNAQRLRIKCAAAMGRTLLKAPER